MANFFQQQILDGNLLLAAIVSLIAGLISFFSPCVLPLVPGYLSYAAGMTELRSKSRTAFGSALFVLGFSVLFISYGALFGSLGSQISTHSRTLTIVLGLLTTAMGIVFLFNERFYRSFKPQWKVRAGLASAPVLGFLFGIGWTPCIGPTLAAVLTLASDVASPAKGATLAFVYALGIGLPFVAIAAGFGWATKSVGFIKRHLRAFNIGGGVLLIALGIMMVTGIWNSFVAWLQISLVGGYQLAV